MVSCGCGFDPWPHLVSSGYSVAESCHLGPRCGSDLVKAVAVAVAGSYSSDSLRPLAWERLCATDVAIKKNKKETKKEIAKPFSQVAVLYLFSQR